MGGLSRMCNEQNESQIDKVDDEKEESDASQFEFYNKLAVGVTLLGFVIFAIIDSMTTKYFQSAIGIFLNWVEKNPVGGFFCVILVYLIATVLFIPGSLQTLGAGFIFANAFGLGWGVFAGSVAVFIGASLGEVAAFLLGRYLLRSWAEGLTKKYMIFKALDIALKE